MSKGLGGIHAGHLLLSKFHNSVVVGHSHLLNYSTHVDLVGRRLHGLVVGCYIDPEADHSYAGIDARNWWRGVVLLHGAENGSFDPQFISMKRLRQEYGKR